MCVGWEADSIREICGYVYYQEIVPICVAYRRVNIDTRSVG